MGEIRVTGMPFSGYEHVAGLLADMGIAVVATPGIDVVRCSPHMVGRALDEVLTAATEAGAVVFVYRNPWDSVLASLCSGDRRLVGDPSVMRAAWQAYHEEVLDRVGDGGGQAWLVAYEAVVDDPAALAAPEHRLPGPPPGTTAPRPGLAGGDTSQGPAAHRGREDPIGHLYQLVYPALIGLLDQLDARAAVPSGGINADAASIAHLLPGASLPAGTGVQVILPCRNDGRFIVEAVASVARSAGEPVELTIVDDGSDDPETHHVLRCLRHAGIEVLTSGGVGICEARNMAIAVSATAAVLPLDSDNMLRPELLEGLPLILEGKADVVCGAQSAFGLQARVYRPPAVTWASMMPHNPVDQCALIRRSLLEAIDGWDPTITWWEDWDLWMSALEKGARFCVLPDVTFDYLVRRDSRTRTVGMDAQSRAAAWRAIYHKHRAALAEVVIEGFITLDEQRIAEAAGRRRWQRDFELLRRQMVLRENAGEPDA